MQNRIAYYIVSLLYLNGKVRVPGIGKITHRHHPASLQEHGNLLSPPQARSLFEQDRRSKNRLLEKFIAYRSHVSRTKARREIARFASQVNADIQTGRSVDLKYLGTLSMQDDEILFSPNQSILNPGHSALTAISLPPRIAHVIEEESLPHAVNDRGLPEIGAVVSDDVAPPHDDDFIEEPQISAPAPSLQEVTGLEEWVDMPTQAEPQVDYGDPVEEMPRVEEKQAVTPVVMVSTEKSEVVVSPPIEVSANQATTPTVAPVAATPPPKKKKDGEVPIAVPVIALLFIGLLVAAFLFYQSRSNHKDTVAITDTSAIPPTIIAEPSAPSAPIPVDETQSSSENAQTDDTAVEQPVNTEEEANEVLGDSGSNAEIERSPSVEEPAQVNPESPITVDAEFHIATGDCAIVMGAFSMSDNAERMVTRLQKMGYHAYTQPRVGLTQVGIRADCNAKNLQIVLGFLRKHVEPHAWVMRPN